jgi:hypothetical protein
MKMQYKRKATVLMSTNVIILYLSFCPFVNQSFCESLFGSRCTIESLFGSRCTIESPFGLLHVGILILVLHRCSLDRSKQSAKLKREQKLVPCQKILHVLHINPFIWDSGSSNYQSTQGILKNNQRGADQRA